MLNIKHFSRTFQSQSSPNACSTVLNKYMHQYWHTLKLIYQKLELLKLKLGVWKLTLNFFFFFVVVHFSFSFLLDGLQNGISHWYYWNSSTILSLVTCYILQYLAGCQFSQISIPVKGEKCLILSTFLKLSSLSRLGDYA